LVILGHPIVRILFQHGRFGPAATTMTNEALLFFSLGLFAYASVKILAGTFYALQNTRIPVAIAAGCVALNIALNIFFIKYTRMGVGGLALSTAAASWLNAGVLFIMLRRRLGLLGGRRILRTVLKSLVGCAGLGLFCRFAMDTPNAIPFFLRLGAAIAGGSAIYMGIARLLQMEEWKPFWSQLRRH